MTAVAVLRERLLLTRNVKMRIVLSGVLLVIYVVAQGHCLTLLDGQETTRTEFCVGDSLILVCNGSSTTYTWLVGNFTPATNDLVVSSQGVTNTINGFTSTFISMEESRLSFVVQAEHNGTEVNCQDFGTGTKYLTLMISVFGPPSAPMVTAVSNEALNSFNVGITSTDPASICISNYNVTLTDGDGMSNSVIVSANISSFDAVALFNINFTLCSLTYQFSVVASTGGGVRTAIGEINFQGLPRVTAMIADNNIIVDIPDTLQDCIVNLTYSFQGESGVFIADTDMLLLSMFNTETCTDGMLRIYPVILGEPRSSLGASVMLCQPDTTDEVTSMGDSSRESISTTDSAFPIVTAGALVTLLGVTVALMAAML